MQIAYYDILCSWMIFLDFSRDPLLTTQHTISVSYSTNASSSPYLAHQCFLNGPTMSYPLCTLKLLHDLPCSMKLRNLHSPSQVTQNNNVEWKNVELCKIRGWVICVLSIPCLLAILHQTHQDICWGNDEALPMNRQFQSSKPRNGCVSELGTPRNFPESG